MQNPAYRQGDVLLIKVSTIPATAKPAPVNGRGIVLAEGEVTGHAHRVAGEATLLIEEDRRYLRCEGDVQVNHEEHRRIQLPAGDYEILIQREYTPGGWENVID